MSVEIKLGKNLSCLKKRATSKAASKKTAKKPRTSSVSVHLLSNDNDEKGDIFYE